ncbi:C2H2-like zinc finger protein [Forsythia ovata]|uniref:C2H2-like zinc finger protein n=1 Tax=Forsythia ovata TaxID=205694 RepID=A0ABD1XBT6_9LAMI
MEVDQELRFVCKLCNKRYPCGKSLGGHMRSHVIGNSAESEEKVEANMKKMMFLNGGGKNFMKESKVVEFGNGQSSYGLRENPKKTWRAVDSTFPLPPEKVCKQCGKGFQSMKALCGHMACHSERERGLKGDHSWTSENPKMVMDSHSDTEVEDRRLRTRSAKSKRYENVVVKSSSFSLANGSSSISEVNEQEQEDIALCLMMLSRDSLNKGGVNSVVESSDNNSVVLETKSSSIDMKICRKLCLDYVNNQDETPHMKKIGDRKSKAIALDDDIAQMENSDSGYFLDECAKVDSDVSVDGFYRNSSFNESKKLSMSAGVRGEESATQFRKNLYGVERYKTELGKDLTKENGYGMTSNSTRMESRKRKNISEGRRMENGSSEVRNKAQTRSKYECLNCKKTFNSYQALGGHRPCHKKSNVRSESQYETGENSLDDNAHDSRTARKHGESVGNKKPVAKNSSNGEDKKVKPMKNKVHVCPFCHKVYKNGQALGGHKRSHFIGGHWENNSRTREIKPELPNLLDLNLPAPEEDEDDTPPILSR